MSNQDILTPYRKLNEKLFRLKRVSINVEEELEKRIGFMDVFSTEISPYVRKPFLSRLLCVGLSYLNKRNRLICRHL